MIRSVFQRINNSPQIRCSGNIRRNELSSKRPDICGTNNHQNENQDGDADNSESYYCSSVGQDYSKPKLQHQKTVLL